MLPPRIWAGMTARMGLPFVEVEKMGWGEVWME